MLSTFNVRRENGVRTIVLDTATSDEINALLATTRPEVQKYVIEHITHVLAATDSQDCTSVVTMALAVIRAAEPRNEMEAMLALQMVAANHAGLDLTRRALKTNDVNFLTQYANAATKFQRTAVAQAEALAKLKRGGEQVVKHVHVNEGGQAVIANTVTTGGGGQ